ncbi:MAG: flagellar hook-length control protein [Bdellovibrionales bacterium]|nr:flagellar hook-length control protein [Massilia sp.]
MALAFELGGRFHFPLLLAGACAAVAVVAGRAAMDVETTRGIDISGLGQIRLTVQHSMGTRQGARDLVRLLPGSTVWPHLLLLLLKDADSGALTMLTILPDSVAPEQFRKIAVSISTIARRDNKFFRKNKIL